MVLASGGQLLAWNLGIAPTDSPWPMFQRDLRNTGTTPSTSGLFRIRAEGNGQCFAIAATSSSSDGPIAQASCGTGIRQLLQLDRVAPQQYRVRHYTSGRCLAAASTSAAAVEHRACAATADQVFRAIPVGSGTFQLRHVASDLCLSSDGGAAAVSTVACSSAAAQVFRVERMGAENLTLRASVTAQSTSAGHSVARVKDGSRSTALAGSSSWASGDVLPQWLQITLDDAQSIDRIDVYTTNGSELKDYELQYQAGTTWVRLLDVTGNTLAYRTHVFPPVNTRRVRLIAKSGPDHDAGVARVNEIEVYQSEKH